MMAMTAKRRTQVYLHKSQLKYAIGIGVMMFIAMLVAFLTPHVLSALNVMPAPLLEERATGMNQFQFFSQTKIRACRIICLPSRNIST